MGFKAWLMPPAIVTGGTPPSPTWDDEVSALAPRFWFNLSEATGNFANSGSAGGTATANGTITYQAGSLNDPSAGIAVENGDGFTFNAGASIPTATVILLIKPHSSLPNTDYFNIAGSAVFLRVLYDGTLRIYDDLDLVTISSAPGVMKSNQWNLVAYQPSGTVSKIFHTSVNDSGVVSEVASGGGVALVLEGSVIVRGSPNANTAIIGAVVTTNTALSLAQLQTLADTLVWS